MKSILMAEMISGGMSSAITLLTGRFNLVLPMLSKSIFGGEV